MRKTNADRIKYYKYVAILLFVVFLICAGFFFLRLWENTRDKSQAVSSDNSYQTYKDKDYDLKEDIDTFLVIGLDTYEDAGENDSYNNNMQSDFVMLYVFDNEAKTCSAVQINRDTMCDINVLGLNGNPVATVNKQIALAHTYGDGGKQSCRNVADSVSDLLMGMKVDHYMSITMDAVPVYNDLVGGVEVTVLDDFTGIDDTLVKGETVTLYGEHALTYVKSRQGLDDSTNSARMERQRQYMEALYDKTMSKIESDDEFIVEATVQMSDYIVSDRSVTQLQDIVRKFAEYEFLGLENIEGETQIGDKYLEFYPDEASIKQIVIELFLEPKD